MHHLFEVFVYVIFQDISSFCLALSLQFHTYFERAVLCAYFLLLNENLCP